MFRRVFRDLVVYGLGDLLVKASALLTMPIYTRVFSTGDYGIINFIGTVSGLLGAFLILGGDSAYARYFFATEDAEERKKLTSTWFLFLLFWCGLITLLLYPFTAWYSHWAFDTPDHALLFGIALLTAPLSLMNTMCSQALRNQFQAGLVSILNLLTALTGIGFSLFAVLVLDWGISGFLLGALGSMAFMLPIRLWTIRSLLVWHFSAYRLKALLAYGAPLVPTSLAYWVFSSSDRWVLAKFADLSQVGLFAIASSLTSLLTFVNGAFGQAWSPHGVKLYETHPDDAQIFFGRMQTYILVTFGTMAVGLTTFARELIQLLTTPQFYEAATAVGPLSLGVVAYATTQITAAGISLKQKTYYFSLYAWIAAFLNLVLNLLLVPIWGMIAAAWSTALAYFFLTLAYGVTSQRLWAVYYEKRRLLSAVCLTLVFVLSAPALPPWSLGWAIALKLGYCLLFLALLRLFQVIDEREMTAIKALISHWRSKRMSQL